jgi:hypothetical protein
MIQEQISTSSPKCLDGNSGFGIVAQTSGMAPNVARDVSMLSGYTHQFAAGDNRNPVVFLHVVRRTGGTNRHIISRVADCGNDYSGRTNRIAHHWIIEESDVLQLSCGPTAILSLPEIFRTQWNEKPQELPRDQRLPNPPISAQKCVAWEQLLGDAGWGGILAERAEKGDPVSLIFEPDMKLLPLLAESFALLPPNIRWKLTFSTFFMKSQEPPGTNKVQIKCILAGTDEEAFARLTPNTFVLDLRLHPADIPVGKYVEVARTGMISQQILLPPQQLPITEQQPQSQNQNNLYGTVDEEEIIDLTLRSIKVPIQKTIHHKQETLSLFKIIGLFSLILLIIGGLGLGMYYYTLIIHDKMIANKVEQEHKEAEAEKMEHERKEAEEKAVVEKTEHERKEAEEKAAAEKTEQEREEAEEKVTAEKAEQKRKEAEEKAAAEKAEQERADEIEQKEIIDGLSNDWKPQLLPLPPGSATSTFLGGSENLWKYRDLIYVQYYSFVDLAISFSEFPQYKLIAKQTKTDSKTEKIFYVFSFIKMNKDVNGNITEEPPKDIAKLILSKDKGFYFEWIQENIGNTATIGLLLIRQFNRLLLSDIEIKLGENAKKFRLFESTRYKQTDKEAPRLGQPFKLWKEKRYSTSEGTFGLNVQDKVILEIKNGELQSFGSNPQKQKFEISNFSDDLPNNALAKPLKITFPDWKMEDTKSYRGTLSLVNATENEDNLQVKIELKIDQNDLKEAQQKLKEAEDAIKKWTNKRGDIDKIISDTNDKTLKIPQEQQNERWQKLQEWQALRNKYYDKKNMLTKLENQMENINKSTSGQFLPIPFSLYLQRYDKPEEKLLLFEVQPADMEK